MKFLHTADWHIGHMFHDHDRTFEHEQFLEFLYQAIEAEKTDVLLISGDIFDVANPSAASMRLFNQFLNQVMKVNPNLQVIIIAGNHDSPSRLEVIKPLLHENIQIIGLVERHDDGSINYENLVIPVKHQGAIMGYCLAVPFLRLGDYPAVGECTNPYAQGVQAFYQQAYELAASKRIDQQFIIALGHLHAQTAEISEQDINERAIMGGLETVSADSFDPGIAYVALGHIHKAQRIAATEHIRYCGSPLPMSFSEIHYKHQLIAFEIEGSKASNIRPIEIPTFIPLLQVPRQHAALEEVIHELNAIKEEITLEEIMPYLQVRILLTGPEPALRHKIEKALEGKPVRLAKIDVRYPHSEALDSQAVFNAQQQLHELNPIDIFSLMYRNKYQSELPGQLADLFRKAAEEVNQEENE